MHDKQISTQDEEKQALSLHSQLLVNRITEQWSILQTPSSETLSNIMNTLPEPYKAMGLNTIAECLVNNMKLHFLEILTKYYQEETSKELQQSIYEDIISNTTSLMRLSKEVSVQTVDELLKLTNITVGIRNLSKVSNLEDAQRWLYKLPTLYQMKLQKERLITGPKISFSFSLPDHSLNNFIHLASAIVETVQLQETDLNKRSDNNSWSRFFPNQEHQQLAVVESIIPKISVYTSNKSTLYTEETHDR